jgi:hypothetical protein
MQFIYKTFIAIAACASLTACSLMSDSLEDCPQGLSVEFVYDYNVERANMFNDHVGSITLYVYDEAGQLVRTQTEDNTSSAKPLRDPNYRMTVVGLQPGEYRLLALANQRQYADISQLSGVRYLRDGENGPMTDLNVTLATQPGAQAATQIAQQLDTLWHGTLRSAQYTLNPTRAAEEDVLVDAQTVSVHKYELTKCIVSLVRDTKRLHISLRQSDDPAHCDIADYDIRIVDINGRLLWDNSVDTVGTPTITYRPFDEWNTYYSGTTGQSYDQRPSNDNAVEETAHADIDFNRLMLRSGNSTVAPAMLYIVHRPDNKTVAAINLPEILKQGRGAVERYIYTAQGFLDRAYDYRLDFILVGDKWEYLSLGIHTLPWTQRFQNVELN